MHLADAFIQSAYSIQAIHFSFISISKYIYIFFIPVMAKLNLINFSSFNVTRSFGNHSNMLIWFTRNMYYQS